jgi:hypothetical protein
MPGRFELEGQVDMTRPLNSSIPNRFSLIHVAGSLLYNAPLPGGSSVYLRAGYGKLRPSGCIYNSLECSSFGAVTGALGFRVPVASAVQFRAEGMVRNRSTYDYTSFGASVGIAVLRSSASHNAGLDDDHDGVLNGRDRCADTPRGALVDQRGCPSDLDGDGVFDGIDRCPGTPKGTPVDQFGCPPRKPE